MLLNELLKEDGFKKICDITKEEAIGLIEHNKDFRYIIDKSYCKFEFDYIGKVLSEVKPYLEDWNIGFGTNANFIKVNLDYCYEFVDGVESISDNFNWFMNKEDIDEDIKKAKDLIEKRNSLEVYSEEYYKLEDDIYLLIDTILDALLGFFNEATKGLSDEGLAEYLYESWAEVYNSDGFYFNTSTWEVVDGNVKIIS